MGRLSKVSDLFCYSLTRCRYLILSLILTGCQLPYMVKSAYNQFSLLNSRVSIDESLKDSTISAEDKRKLQLAQRARDFAANKLGLNATKNYTSFVKLNRPYVTYAVSASPKWEVKSYQWSFPIVGKVPYKGFFNEQDALDEAKDLSTENYDTYVRGVSAYSTLGWFNDPLTSSMLKYHDYDLVNTIIHESVHATLFIKHEADFNERLAVFLGNKGMELFYLEEEGRQSRTLIEVRKESEDEKKFAAFMGEQIKEIQAWYLNLKEADKREEDRQARLRLIETNFNNKPDSFFQTNGLKKMKLKNINNARLVSYKTYYQDLGDFELFFTKCHSDFREFVTQMKKLEKSEDPLKDLKNLSVHPFKN